MNEIKALGVKLTPTFDDNYFEEGNAFYISHKFNGWNNKTVLLVRKSLDSLVVLDSDCDETTIKLDEVLNGELTITKLVMPNV